MKNKKITILLNHEVSRIYSKSQQKVSLNISSNEKKFYSQLLDYYDSIELLAFIMSDDKVSSFNDWDISQEDRISIKKISLFQKNNKKVYKLLNYGYSFLQLLYTLNKKNDLYIYIRNNNAVIASNILKYTKLKYGLYIRGELKDKNPLIKSMYKKLIKHASFTLCTGDYLLSEVKPLNRNSELVVPMLKFDERDLFLKENYCFRNDCCNILFVGRIEYDKGVYELLTVITELIEVGYKMKLHLVGSGKIKANFSYNRDVVRCYGLVTDREEIKILFQQSDLFILPSHHEGFARVLYEAMTFGTPIIVSDINGVKVTMKDNENCLKFEVKNKEHLKEKVIKLYEDQILRQKFAQNGHKFMTSLYQKNKDNSHAKQVIHYFKN